MQDRSKGGAEIEDGKIVQMLSWCCNAPVVIENSGAIVVCDQVIVDNKFICPVCKKECEAYLDTEP